MDANDVLESYVADVATQLPRAQRNDVAFELRMLLNDELSASAHEQGVAPDTAMAVALVRRFGRPAETAARYTPRLALIDPTDNHNLMIWALVGAVLLKGSDVSWLAWMGALLLFFALLSWSRQRWPDRFAWQPRRYRDPDAANRPGFVAAAVFTVIFPLAMYAAPAAFVHTAFLGVVPTNGLSLTPAFAASWQRIAVVTCLIAAAAAYAVTALQGRLHPWSRWTQITVNAGLGLLLVMHANPMLTFSSGERFAVFASATSNQSAGPFFLLAGGICLLGALYEGYKEWTRVRPASSAAAAA